MLLSSPRGSLNSTPLNSFNRSLYVLYMCLLSQCSKQIVVVVAVVYRVYFIQLSFPFIFQVSFRKYEYSHLPLACCSQFFMKKILKIFLFLNETMYCDHSSESAQRADSYEGSRYMVSWRNQKTCTNTDL